MLISISSSKGGAGKSTLTSIFTTSFFTHYGIKTCIIDLDPQESILDTRKKELKGISDNSPKPNSLYYQTFLKNQENMGKNYPDIYRLDITQKFEDMLRKIKTLEKDYDIVFIDFPGSLNLHENTLLILKILDYIFIPYYADQNTNSSSLRFIKGLIDLKKNNKTNANFFVFFNRYQKIKNVDNFNEAKNFFEKNNIPLLKSVVYEAAEIERYSTIVPLKPSNAPKSISHIVLEILSILNLK